MKLKFKEQQFQSDAVNAVCDVFEGQGKDNHEFILGKLQKGEVGFYGIDSNIYAWKNAKISGISYLIHPNQHKLNHLRQVMA